MPGTKSIKDPRVSDNINYVFADRNCRLQASCADDRLLSFTTAEEFDGLVSYLGETTKNNRAITEIHDKYNNPDFKADSAEWDSGFQNWNTATPTYATAAAAHV